MAFDTFTPPLRPSAGSTDYQWQPRVLTAQFGDGYKQTTPDGINANGMRVRLTWANLTIAQATTVRSFLDAHVGLVFKYTLPDEGIARKWQALSWSKGWENGLLGSLSCDLEERFDWES